MTQEKNFLGDNPWFLVNGMTKRVELLYVQQKFKSSLENIWKHEKEFQEGSKQETKSQIEAIENKHEEPDDLPKKNQKRIHGERASRRLRR